VVESLTRWPIDMAKITVEGEGYALKILETNKKGSSVTEMLPETYQWKVEKAGYESSYKTKTIGPGNDTVLFELTKILPESNPVTTTQPKPVQKQLPLVSKKDTGVLSTEKFVPNNIVFLIDISGSMKEPEKLPLLKKSIATLLKPIRETDKITIITYAEEVKTIVPTSNGSQKTSILQQLDSLKAAGVTAGSAGIKKAYELAESAFVTDGNNQVILATDGVFRVSAKDKKMIEKFAASTDKKIILSVTGFGNQEDALNMLKGLSTLGNGSFIHIRNERESVNALLEEIKGRSKR
jgi:Mg-chelatase subunit ChlD